MRLWKIYPGWQAPIDVSARYLAFFSTDMHLKNELTEQNEFSGY